MRILYFSKGYTPHDYRFLSSLSQTENEIFYMQLEPVSRQTEDRDIPRSVKKIAWAGGTKVFRWRDALRLKLDLQRVIRELQPDIIHAGPIQTCAFLVALAGFPRLLTMSWGYDLMMDADRNWLFRFITQYTLKRSAHFTSDAAVTRDKAVLLGMDARRMTIFPWGVDTDHFAPTRLEQRNTPEHGGQEAVTLFCSRTWESIYGVDVLANAFVNVARECPYVNMILLGGGSMEASIRKTLAEGGVIERVFFGGQVAQRDLPRWYCQSDIYISPSHVDGTSVTLLEAMACGLPCLVSDIPGNMDWIVEGVNGWTFRDGDVDDLTEKILLAIRNRESLHSLGDASRRTAVARANWKKNFGSLLDAYHAIAADRDRKGPMRELHQ